jgi:hypothetical protein
MAGDRINPTYYASVNSGAIALSQRLPLSLAASRVILASSAQPDALANS